MATTTTQYKRCQVVKTDGRIDSSNSDELLKVFRSVTDKGVFKIVFDMDEVTFLSSKGWWVLVETQKTCKRYNRGELVLANVPENIQNSLDLIGMKHYFKLFDNAVDAVGSF